MTKEQKLAYAEIRNSKVVTFSLGDAEIKKRLRKVAEAEGRTVNNWINHHVMPAMLETMERQYAKAKAAKKV